MDPAELDEWFDSLDDMLHRHGPDRVRRVLALLQQRAYQQGVTLPFTANTPYINSIHHTQQPRFPGNREIERRIKSIIRWNAMAMVVRANRESAGIGGHISTYASAATLLEIGFNHFFRGKTDEQAGDLVYFQGHASPGVYARAFLEGRLTEKHLERFRREIPRGTGLSSYPHPWLMPDFWQFPTVSMGLGPIMAIYQARFLRYLEHRGLLETSPSHVWCFVGDGEVDEPESLGAITLASRENLDNLIFVINCNLQRLDGPVRGNGKIIQELEAAFRGAGWNCLKVIWGGDWDPLLDADEDGLLLRRMDEVVDGQYQKYTVESGEYIREHFFGANDRLKQMVDHLSDEQLEKLNRGGHDPEKVYAAFKAAVEHVGAPTVILAKTIKGYGLGETGEGRNITHQQKKLNEDELREFRSRFGIPIGDDDIAEAPFYKPPADSPEMEYLFSRRNDLGGFLPVRQPVNEKLEIPPLERFDKKVLNGGSEMATTMAFGRILSDLLKDKHIGKRIVPIIPDEARTFGLEALFRQCGIYSSKGQLYEPVDADQILYYRETQQGQILEEGINEAGAISSFIAAGTSYSNQGISMIPFYIYYSMFGFQRVGDLIWAAADSRAKGFLVGGTSGRTTLSGEGLQHQDGHSQLAATTVPNLHAYDPAYGYELAVIIRDGLRRMFTDGDEVFYYLSVYNEVYDMPPLPDGAEEGILKGIYLVDGDSDGGDRPQLFGSGPILREVRRAKTILQEKFDVDCDVWSATSFSELCREAHAVERWNRLHPAEDPRASYLHTALMGRCGPYIAATDNVRLVPEQIRPWVPGRYVTLGTDGFGRSESREGLRRHFEVNAEHVAFATLSALSADGRFDASRLPQVRDELEINSDQVDPAVA
jgi:pyruvate dehydrogenase E1 component